MSMNLENTQKFNFLNQKLKIMCMNWHYLHYPEKHKHLSLEVYISLSNTLLEQLVNHELFEPMVGDKILVKHLLSSEAFHTIFNTIQENVFKILDLIDKKARIDGDFKNES